MSRVFDFTVIGVIWIIAIVIHLMGIELFQPGSPLYRIATDGTGTMNGQARADLWFEILTIWVPFMAGCGITVWGMIREYRRQAVTRAQRVPP